MSEANQHYARTVLFVFGIAAFVLIVFSSSVGSMWQLWQTSDHRHGLLVIPIAAFLVWRQRAALEAAIVRVFWPGILLVVLLVLLWVASRLAGVQVLEHFAAIGLVPAAVLTLAGPSVMLTILFPLLFLFLAIPVGDALVPVLVQATAEIATLLLKLSGVPVFRSGQYLSLPGGEFVVADVCSGLRYLVSGVMVSLLFGYLSYSTLRKQAILVATTAVILVIANGVRAYIVMAVASATDMRVLGGEDHIWFGWLLFGLIIVALLWVAGRYTDDVAPEQQGDAAARNAPIALLPLVAGMLLLMLSVTVKPLQQAIGEFGTALAAAVALVLFMLFLGHGRALPGESSATLSSGRAGAGAGLMMLITVAVLVIAPVSANRIEKSAVMLVEELILDDPAPCELVGNWSPRWSPEFANPDWQRGVDLTCGNSTVSVFVAAYGSAVQGADLASSTNRPLPNGLSRYADRMIAGNGVVETVIDSPGYQAMVWHWYEVDGRTSRSRLHTKWLQVLALVRGRPAGGRIIVLETETGGEPAAARDRLAVAAASVESAPVIAHHDGST